MYNIFLSPDMFTGVNGPSLYSGLSDDRIEIEFPVILNLINKILINTIICFKLFLVAKLFLACR